MKALGLFVICQCLFVFSGYAQEETQVISAGGKYINLRVKALDKYNDRLERQQKRLLGKLKRNEQKLAFRLKYKDSVAYARLQQQPLTYDSIGKLANADSSIIAATSGRQRNKSIDSLKAIEGFLQSKATALNDPQLQSSGSELGNLKNELNYRSHINDLISQRTNFLKSLASSQKLNLPILTGIQKDVFYGKQKMNVFRQMEEEPTKAEDKALEYLQGTDGFDKYMDKATAGPNSMQALKGSESNTDLQNLGFQTKQQLQGSLQQKYGNSLGAVTQSMSGQIQVWQGKTQGIQNTISDAKQTKQSLQQLAYTQKPDFKINPMRGLPFWKRIEKQYNWQTTRPTPDGQPAMLEMSAMAGFKHTPKLTYGIGLATQIGLGQSWTNVHVSFQGLGLRSYAEWKWQYGIGAYAGYERMYKQAVFVTDAKPSSDLQPTVHNTTSYNESILIGLTKTYHMNSKYNGAIQLLYDVWWSEKGLRSPIVLRFSTVTK